MNFASSPAQSMCQLETAFVREEFQVYLFCWLKGCQVEEPKPFVVLAHALGRRRSEVHAFSASNSCLRFSRDKSSVTLLMDPAFLGKNQIPDKGAEPI
jgi:hypothetical protein